MKPIKNGSDCCNLGWIFELNKNRLMSIIMEVNVGKYKVYIL